MIHRINLILANMLCIAISCAITLIEISLNIIPFVFFSQWFFNFSGPIVDWLYETKQSFN